MTSNINNGPSEAIDVNGDAATGENTQNGISVENKSSKRAVVVVNQPESEEEEEEEEEEEGDEDGQDDGSAELPEDMEEVELIHLKLQSSQLSRFNIPRLANNLKKLCLRQNNITTLDPELFGKLLLLEELDLYDNKVKDVGNALDKLDKLRVLDLSFNLLRSIPEGLQYLTSLDTVYFVQNKISKISGLSNIGATLRSLELGSNRIRKIEHLDALVNLEELWLGKNKITKLEGLSTLSRLKILSIQSNRITKLEGLEDLKALEEIYLSHNGVERIEGLSGNTKLRTLDVSNNFISVIENISHLSNLEEFWASGNKIDTLNDLEPQLKHIQPFETIYLEGNPCQRKEEGNYRRKIMLYLPQVKQIDATFVKHS